MHCRLPKVYDEVGPKLYQNDPQKVRRQDAMQEFAAHLSSEYFKAVLPKRFRDPEAMLAVMLFKGRHGEDKNTLIFTTEAKRDDPRHAPRERAIPWLRLTRAELGNEALDASLRTIRLFERFIDGGLPDNKGAALKRGLIEYAERCTAYGLAMERGDAWHTLAQIRKIMAGQGLIEPQKDFKKTVFKGSAKAQARAKCLAEAKERIVNENLRRMVLDLDIPFRRLSLETGRPPYHTYPRARGTVRQRAGADECD